MSVVTKDNKIIGRYYIKSCIGKCNLLGKYDAEKPEVIVCNDGSTIIKNCKSYRSFSKSCGVSGDAHCIYDNEGGDVEATDSRKIYCDAKADLKLKKIEKVMV